MRGFFLDFKIRCEAPVGANLLAMAVYQSGSMALTRRYREQARSHRRLLCCGCQFFSGINTASSSPITMNTSNFAGWLALAFFDTRCSEPAASYQNSPAL